MGLLAFGGPGVPGGPGISAGICLSGWLAFDSLLADNLPFDGWAVGSLAVAVGSQAVGSWVVDSLVAGNQAVGNWVVDSCIFGSLVSVCSLSLCLEFCHVGKVVALDSLIGR